MNIDYSSIIIDTINSLFSSLLSSINNSLYSLLDELVFIDTSIISDSFFEKAFGSSYNMGILAIANSLLFGIVLYYSYKLLLAPYSNTEIEKPHQFIFRIIIFGICINSSLFICKQIIFVNSLISDAFREIGIHIFNIDLSFNSLISDALNITGNTSFSLFSFDGIITGAMSFGLIGLLFSYSLRYIMLKIFILISPFAILSLINTNTSWLFKTWIRTFFSLLIVQSFVSLILLIIFSIGKYSTSLISKLLYLGGVYALSKANGYIRELIGGISTDINANLSMLKFLIK